MSRTITPAPVRKSIRVAAPQAKAFEVFTAGIGRWWPKSHHIGAADLAAMMIEPRAGGRWYEVGVDGSECVIGKIAAWEPPGRVVLVWQVSGDWKFDPDGASEVEVRFTPEGENVTLVELEHRGLETLRMSEAMRAAVESPNGWGALLALFAAQAAA